MSIIKLLAGALVIAACGGSIGAARVQDTQTPQGFTPAQRKVADEIISIFENDTPVLQYGYIENLHDGRGFTAGRAGFTTATGDMLQVLKLYDQQKPNNCFAPLMPLLQKKAATEDDGVNDLPGMDKMWIDCSSDPAFCRCQDQIADQMIYQPALKHWREEGLTTPLGLLIIYDTVVEHGDGKDPDGTPALIAKADELAHGNPGTGVREVTWLHAFLEVRREDLMNPKNEKTQAAWSDSATRCDALNNIVYDGNIDLTPPINLSVFGETWTVQADTAVRADS